MSQVPSYWQQQPELYESSLTVAESATPEELVLRCQKILSHAWMVRTFIKHSPEVEDFPELMMLARTVFDSCRALETRVESPAEYFKMLGKKIGKLKKAVERFQVDAPLASTHTNFQQAAISIATIADDLTLLLEIGKKRVAQSRDSS